MNKTRFSPCFFPLGDTAIRRCSTEIGKSMALLEIINSRLVFNCKVTRISIITTIYTTCLNPMYNKRAPYVDEIGFLYAHLERIATTKIPALHKALLLQRLLLKQMGYYSTLESTVAVLKRKNTDKVMWHAVISDLIPQWKQLNRRNGSQGTHPKNHDKFKGSCNNKGRFYYTAFRTRRKLSRDFCAKLGHEAEDGFLIQTPKIENCFIDFVSLVNHLQLLKIQMLMPTNEFSLAEIPHSPLNQ